MEAWIETLKAACEAGYYKTEASEGDQVPLPSALGRGCTSSPFWQAQTSPESEEEIVLTVPRDCYDLLRRVASAYEWPVEAAAHLSFLLGVREYAEDRRRKSGLGRGAGDAADAAMLRILRRLRG